ncbi:MAG TPA: hypothetical protein VN033_13485 [Vulgatibacter sp.]|nr:hypothetical protein [Vulgatibacter sp.]
MKTLLITALLGVTVLASGCTSTRRSITHVRTESDKAYIAYAEWDQGLGTWISGTNDRSKVKRCSINPDNSLSCEEAEELNALLNP